MIATALLSAPHAFAATSDNVTASSAPLMFNPAFLRGTGTAIDVSKFARTSPLAAGTYRVDLYVNNLFVERGDVAFTDVAGGDVARPCFTRAMLDHYGVNVSTLSPADQADACIDVAEAIKNATASYDSATYRLDLSIPQVALRQSARGQVDPSRWDSGETALTLNYNANTYHSTGENGSSSQTYLGLETGLNAGDWRLRNRGSMQWNHSGDTSTRTWTNLDTYAQRDITGWRSQLTLGDSHTSGEYFDSVGVRGVQLSSDDRMLPDSLRGYAPVIRGTANSNARVTVRQNNQVIYETTVAPGAFEITDLNPTGYGGDLVVTVTEADGSQQSYSVANSAVPQSLRPGVTRYAVSAGQVRNDNLLQSPYLAQFGMQRGLTNLLTGYGAAGATNQGYVTVMGGAALNTSWGAVGFDVTGASTQLPGTATQRGLSMRTSYSKTVADTGTTMGLAAYRYSTQGYFGLNDAITAYDTIKRGSGTLDSYQRPRNRFELNLNQSIGKGQIYVNGSVQNYWQQSGSNANYQAGYSNTYHGVAYSVSAQRTDDGFGKKDNRVYLSMSLPLNFGTHSQTLYSSVGYGKDSGTTAQTSLSGTALENAALSYGVNANYNSTTTTSVGVNAQYASAVTTLNGSVSHSSGYTQVSAGATGGLVVHRGGVTLSPRNLDAVALVHAPGAEGAQINGLAGVQVDQFGYALVPDLVPYRSNAVTLDPKNLTGDVEFKSTRGEVVPRAGAVSRIEFETVSGRTVIIHTVLADGRPAPFGASVLDDSGANVGVVGQGGTVFTRGIADKGVLTLQLSEGKACRISYQLDPKQLGKAPQTAKSGFATLEARCVPQTEATVVATAGSFLTDR
ncbi:outer membrane usher protein [Silvimonas terrae]|uniref:Outer membrane usher protein n=1 Tax=Silvimonas terrae TaxID=300266 RepID=A0A840RHM8_9NEIS|nr:fimbria/pilus outer membrane usher protein [Silvimonas terrae]MBB5191772.1 outer membrane usher protein [Silvimonas terrae]